MPYTNIPSVGAIYTDGNLGTIVRSSQPKVLILGTSKSGRSDSNYQVISAQTAAREFGNDGTLIQSMYEAMAQGADNIFLRRLATGTPAVLSGICRDNTSDEGITITTLEEDAEAGELFSVWYDPTEARLAIFNNDTEEWIYDSAGILAIDLGLISVSGTISEGAPESAIGSYDAPLELSAVVAALDAAYVAAYNAANNPDVSAGAGEVAYGLEFIASTDGENPSRMELFEALLEVYQELDFQDVDILIVPPKATVDCPNIVKDSPNAAFLALDDYPAADTDEDMLARVFIQEYKHKLYFWWKTEETPNDGAANIFPTPIGSADADQDIDGTALTSADYHEVNFAWALAKFCKHASTSYSPVIGFIGVEKPAGFDRINIADWIGELPTYSEQSDGTTIVDTSGNGAGLLGCKFLAGEEDFNESLKDGGFLDTEEPYYLDGTVLVDENERNIDIGMYIVLNHAWPILSNAWIDPLSPSGRSRVYVNSGVASAAGKYATLPENVEAAGQSGVLRNVSLSNLRIPASALDNMLGIRLNGMRNDSSLGVIMAGSKTAARPDSDYTKISTMRCVAKHVKGIMLLGTSLQGQPSDALRLLGFQNQIETFLRLMQDQGFNSGASVVVLSSAADRKLGRVTVRLTMIPPYSVEQITIEVALSE